MHLSNREFFQLLLPFLLALGIYIFRAEIIQQTELLFPKIQKNTKETLDSRVALYLQIKNYQNYYESIEKKVQKRQENIPWISREFFYLPAKITQNIPQASVKKSKEWRLEALFPQQNVAIINAKIVHVNSTIDSAKVIKITNDKVLLKTNKGLKWLSLFH